MVPHLGVSNWDPLLDDKNFKSSFGAPTLRMFLYDDESAPSRTYGKFASNIHCDKGLFTLAPRSTAPAIEMWHPLTHQRLFPEHNVLPNEWLIFPGEAMGYMTSGRIPGNVHRVAWTKKASPTDPPRMAMPMFLRAEPGALLTRTGLSNRELMERHSVGKRPYVTNNDWR